VDDLILLNGSLRSPFFKPFIMMNKVGSLLSIGKKDTKYELISYLGEWRRKSDGQRVLKVAPTQVLEDGRDHVYYEVWSCLNLNTGAIEDKKIPVYVYLETNQEDFVDSDRKDVINDNNEVTSLLDHYSCWYSNFRDSKNFHLEIVQQKHVGQINKLRELDSESSGDYAVGIRLKLMMKENPNSIIRRRFKEWETQFPDLFTKLKTDVYMSSITQNNVVGSSVDNIL